LVAGRFFEPAEIGAAAKVAVIGQTVARELFGDGDPLDQVIRVNRVPLVVIGLLERKGQNAFGADQDDVVVVPIGTLHKRIQGRATSRLRSVGS
ncbi:ABC transporter permease, partial [Staphylococcus aureus]|nr:ABC transporter permease [Staphylococcus aureus]